MSKLTFIALLLVSINTFNFGGIVDSVTSTTNSATNTVTETINQISRQADNIVSSAGNSIKAMAETVVSQTKSNLDNAVNLAVETVKNQVDNIVSTIDSLSAQMCESQCTNVFNLPCFLLFRCTDKIKKFCFMIVLPIAIVLITCFGFTTGLFSIPCICRVLMMISGVSCIICIIKSKCKKMRQEQKEAEEKCQKGETDSPETQNRFATHQ